MQLKNQRSRSKSSCGFSIILILKGSRCFLLNKYMNFDKNETESKIENPPHTFRDTNLVLNSLYKSPKLKVKLWWLGVSSRKKKSAFLVTFIFSAGRFFYICVLAQCLVYWINFENIYTFIHQKILLHALFCLFLKLPKTFKVSSRDSPKILSVYYIYSSLKCLIMMRPSWTSKSLQKNI